MSDYEDLEGPCVDETCGGTMSYEGGIMVCDTCGIGMRPDDYEDWLDEVDDEDDDWELIEKSKGW